MRRVPFLRLVIGFASLAAVSIAIAARAADVHVAISGDDAGHGSVAVHQPMQPPARAVRSAVRDRRVEPHSALVDGCIR